MAERVQVQGLGDAVPGIQPTIQRAGQYSVGQRRAGRNKLMDLADALSQVNPILQQYTQVADIEAERFEDELSRKSPEEIQAMLQKTEGEFDKQVRKGAMSWLTSPVNQKRKRMAIGALMHDEYERELKSRVENPANSDANIENLITESKDTLRQKYEALNSVFVSEGFEGAVKNTTRKYTLAHDTISTEQARQEVKLAGKSILYNSSLLDSNGDISDINNINKWWEENEGSLAPSELFKLIEDVAVTHAIKGDEEAALEWVEYASGHLKVGTTKMGDPKIKDDDVFGQYGAEESRLRERIENIVTQQGNKEKADAALELQDIDGLATDIFSRIKKGTYTTEEGDEISTQEEAFDYLVGKVQKSSNPYVKGLEGVSIVKKAQTMFDMPEDYGSLRLKQTVAQQFTGISSYSSMINLKTRQVLTSPGNLIKSDIDGKTSTNPTLELEAERLGFEIDQLRQDKFLEVSSGTYKTVEGEDVVNAPLKTQTLDMNNWNKQYANMFQEKLEAYGVEKSIEKKAKDKIERAEPINSYIDPSTTVDDATSSFYEPHNFFDLEKAVKQGNFAEAKKIAAVLSEKKYLPRGRERFETYQPLKEALNRINSQTASITEKETARKKVLLYSIASKGSNFYNAENIKRGTVNIEGTEIKIEDKEALQDLSLVYPMISKKRLQQLSRETDPEANDIFELYNALFGTDLKEGDEKDEAMVKVFIRQQAKLYE